MKYKIYYRDDICKPHNKGSKCLWRMGRVKFPDTTILTISVSGYRLNYSITNPSARTLRLLSGQRLKLGIFVIENKKRYSGKDWRSAQSLMNHPNRKVCSQHVISNLNGYIDLKNDSYSTTLGFIFKCATEFQSPYRVDGYEDLFAGLGTQTDSFRPYKISNGIRISVQNSL